jgi:hypothetical protein
MATPLELLQGAIAQLRLNNERLEKLEQQVQTLTARLALHAQHIQALEQSESDCMVGGTPT